MIGQDNSIVVTDEGVYTAVATNNNNCPNEVDINVINAYCKIQKGISANNDGFNDVFELTNLDVRFLQIYNRYGMEVYSKNNYTNEWKGESNDGDELPDGTYYYILHYNNLEKRGWVFIKR
jgi:gliding motility-associated-like protein